MDEIEFGGGGVRRRRPLVIGLVVVLAAVLGLVFWQRQVATPPRSSAPVVGVGHMPNVVVCCGERTEVSDDKNFRQGFEIRNIGNAPATITDLVVETPASFHQLALGLVATSDGNEIDRSNIRLLAAYTMPPQSAAYVVVAGFVTCPAAGVSADPRFSFKVDNRAMSFDTPAAGSVNWEANVATTACGT